MNGDWLVKPWMRILLITIGGATGGVAYLLAPAALIGAMSKTAAVFLGTVWVTMMAFALKVTDITEAPGLSAGEHEQLELKVRGAVRRVWIYAGLNAVAAVLVLIPSVMVDAKESLVPWMVIAAGCGIGFAIYSVLAHAWWQEELRRFRSSQRVAERLQSQVERLGKMMAEGRGAATMPEATRTEIAGNNTRIDWPIGPTAH